MGGVVLRNLDNSIPTASSKRIGGLITVNSPNYGAPIVNSIQNGSVLSAAQNGLNKLLKGPNAQLLQIPFNIITNTFYSDDIANAFITEEFINSYISGNTANDLKPNSSCLNSINSYTSPIPQISIWGSENSPVHWRMLGSLMNYGEDDYAFAKFVNIGRGVYNGWFVYNTTMAGVYAGLSFFQPWVLIASANCVYKATQWNQGKKWIDGSESVWCSLIETTKTEQRSYWVRVWFPCTYPPIDKESADDDKLISIDPDCGHWVWKQRIRYVSVNYPSDGLLPQYTQELQSIPTGNRYRIDGANHMEVLDMSNSTLNGVRVDGTKNTLDLIFNRQTGDFFHTPE